MLSPLLTPTLELLADLKRFEGEPGTQAPALMSYPDPLSKGPPWTNGWGHTGLDVHPNSPISEETAETNLLADATNVLVQLNRNLSWFQYLDNQPRIDAMANLGFNLGVGKLLGFHDFLNLMAGAHYVAAAGDLENTAWYKEVNGDGRGDFVCALISKGVR